MANFFEMHILLYTCSSLVPCISSYCFVDDMLNVFCLETIASPNVLNWLEETIKNKNKLLCTLALYIGRLILVSLVMETLLSLIPPSCYQHRQHRLSPVHKFCEITVRLLLWNTSDLDSRIHHHLLIIPSFSGTKEQKFLFLLYTSNTSLDQSNIPPLRRHLIS